MLFDKLAELKRDHEPTSSLMQEPEMAEQPTSPSTTYLGPNNIGNMAATAQHKLINATYRGEGRHWDFDRYATLHKEQHTILERLKEFGYAGMDEESKTRHLLGGIKTTTLDSVKTQILCNSELRQDFAPRLTSPKSSAFHHPPPRLKLNRRRGNPKEELRIGITPSKNTRLSQMSKRKN